MRAAAGSSSLCRRSRLWAEEEVALLRIAVVEELGVDTLLIAGALLDHAVTQAHQCPDLLDVLGRYPRLRKPVYDQQIPLLHHVAPAGGGLHCDGGILSGEALT